MLATVKDETGLKLLTLHAPADTSPTKPANTRSRKEQMHAACRDISSQILQGRKCCKNLFVPMYPDCKLQVLPEASLLLTQLDDDNDDAADDDDDDSDGDADSVADADNADAVADDADAKCCMLMIDDGDDDDDDDDEAPGPETSEPPLVVV